MFMSRRYRASSHRRKVKDQPSVGRSHFRERAKTRRAIAPRNPDRSFEPPEDWHESTDSSEYRIVVRKPGRYYHHVVTPDQISTHLSKLPQNFLRNLEVVQLSAMTRKKHISPCYGLQWGRAIYLYPFDENLDEHFHSPPPRSLVIETKMYGGRWEQNEPGVWRLVWTESAARDFVLNNVLIHELGHLIDNRNSSYQDQERYAEWFAIKYGYLRSGGRKRRQPNRNIRRRHHRK